MFVAPGSAPLGYRLGRGAAEQIARHWWVLLLNGALLVVAGVVIFSIDWTIGSLATFIGALLIFEGVVEALATGIDVRVRRTNVNAGLLSLGSVEAGGGEGSDRRRRVQQTWSDYVGAVHRRMDQATAGVDLAQAGHAADSAESDASYAIGYAFAAIEQAECAVLRAEFARVRAENLEAGAPASA